MLAVNNNNNINFQARLDVSKVTKNKKMWNEVAEMFETKTAKKPYTLHVDDSDGEICFDTFNSSKFYDHEHQCILPKDGAEKFMAMTPEKKVNKLVKLLNIFRRQDKTNDGAIKLLRQLEKDDKYGTLFEDIRPMENSYDRILWTTQDLASKDRNIAASKDAILRDAKFSY